MPQQVLIRLIGFALSGCLAVYLGFVHFDPEGLETVYRQLSYWILLAGLGISLVSLLSTFLRAGVLRPPARPFQLGRGEWGPLLALGLLVLLSLVLARAGFNTVNDEPVLAATARVMHESGQAGVPVMADWSPDGAYQTTLIKPDKRPLLVPLIFALGHDVLGYRLANLYGINGVFGALILVLLYLMGRTWARSRTAGLLLAALWASLPVFQQHLLGAGLGIINCAFLLLVLMLAAQWLRRRTATCLVALCFTTALAAQVRYESIFLVLPLCVVVGLGWWRQGQLLFPGTLCLLPFVFLPVAWSYRLIQSAEGRFFMQSGEPTETIFSLGHFGQNSWHALQFLVDGGYQLPNSLLLVVLGSTSLVGLLRRQTGPKRGKEPGPRHWEWAALALTVALLAMTLLLLGYFWADWRQPEVSRLTLPFHLALLLAVAASLRFWSPRRRRVGLIVTGIFLLVYTGPNVWQNRQMERYAAREVARASVLLLQSHPFQAGDYLITASPQLAMALGLPAVSPRSVQSQPEILSAWARREGARFWALETVHPESERLAHSVLHRPLDGGGAVALFRLQVQASP